MALPASMRFRGRKDVKRLLRYGRKYTTGLGRVFIAQAIAARGRILFVVSTAVAKKSTDRNKIKRRLGEWTRVDGPEFLNRVDAAVLVSKEAAGLPKKALMNLAKNSFAQIK